MSRIGNSIDRKQINGCLWLGVRTVLTENQPRVLSGGDDTSLTLDCGALCTTVHLLKVINMHTCSSIKLSVQKRERRNPDNRMGSQG